VKRRKTVGKDDPRYQVAENFVLRCLEITDGSVEVGLARIGTSVFEDTVQKVIQGMPVKGESHE